MSGFFESLKNNFATRFDDFGHSRSSERQERSWFHPWMSGFHIYNSLIFSRQMTEAISAGLEPAKRVILYFGLTYAVRRHSHTFASPPSAAALFFIRCCDYSCSPAPPFSSVSSVDLVSMETGSAVDYFLIRACLVRQTHLPSSSSS